MNTEIICITGASGFLGSHLIRYLSTRLDVQMRALFHNRTIPDDDLMRNIDRFTGDLLHPSTLIDFPVKDSTVINLVYLNARSLDDNLLAMNNLAAACAKTGIKRLIHCSTAVVAGRVDEEIVNEESIPHPASQYERNKLAIERMLLEKYSDIFEVIILRPTAVFGPGGQNLIKQANYLLQGSRIVNYLRSCLFDYRKMNLVAVENVTAALEFLIYFGMVGSKNEIFIISDDEDKMNEYRAIESLLTRSFKQKDYPVRLIPFPIFILKMLLRLTGKSNYNPYIHYSCEKLLKAGFKKPTSITEGVKQFADWYIANNFMVS
jgi:nucleoside-diphosphate-sugar epimerase